MEGSDGSSGVYRIRTLRLFFHIGRVECVMCHSSLSHEMVGLLYPGGAAASEKVGGRSVTGGISQVLWVAAESGSYSIHHIMGSLSVRSGVHLL